jgi:hypothetical protein
MLNCIGRRWLDDPRIANQAYRVVPMCAMALARSPKRARGELGGGMPPEAPKVGPRLSISDRLACTSDSLGPSTNESRSRPAWMGVVGCDKVLLSRPTTQKNRKEEGRKGRKNLDWSDLSNNHRIARQGKSRSKVKGE